MSDKALVTIEQKVVAFYDDELIAIRARDAQIYASISQMCRALGIDTQAQRRRIERHNVLAKGLGVANLATPGGVQSSYVLRVDLIPLWLSGIRTSAVNDEVRPKLEQFQEQAAAVLWEAFQDGRLTADPDFAALLEQDTEAVQAYKMLQALVKLAQSQIVIESKLETHTAQLSDHEQRLEEIETQLGDESRTVSQEQASQISQAVKAIAMVWSKQSSKNQYGAVYGRLYESFGITSYKLLPANRFQDAMNWLTSWYQELTDSSDLPF